MAVATSTAILAGVVVGAAGAAYSSDQQRKAAHSAEDQQAQQYGQSRADRLKQIEDEKRQRDEEMEQKYQANLLDFEADTERFGEDTEAYEGAKGYYEGIADAPQTLKGYKSLESELNRQAKMGAEKVKQYYRGLGREDSGQVAKELNLIEQQKETKLGEALMKIQQQSTEKLYGLKAPVSPRAPYKGADYQPYQSAAIPINPSSGISVPGTNLDLGGLGSALAYSQQRGKDDKSPSTFDLQSSSLATGGYNPTLLGPTEGINAGAGIDPELEMYMQGL